MYHNQKGNVLFYILIGVGLLAALSYVVAQSSRGNINTISEQQAKMYAVEIIEIGNTVNMAVSQVRLRGYNENEISFVNDVITGYDNVNCDNEECEIFSINGGGVNYHHPKTVWLDNSYNTDLRYGEIYFNATSSAMDLGTNDDDLIMFIPYIKQEICIAINNTLGIHPANDTTPSETNGPFAINIKFTGTYGPALDRKVSGDGTTGSSEILHNHSAGCTEASGTASTPATGTYHFYQVLLSR